jgi:hypothetical protein
MSMLNLATISNLVSSFIILSGLTTINSARLSGEEMVTSTILGCPASPAY